MNKLVKGFTMIEIIVVISILGILSTIGTVSFFNIQKSSRDKIRANDITVIGEALEKYYDQNGQYPDCDGELNDILKLELQDFEKIVCNLFDASKEKPIVYEVEQQGGNIVSWKLSYFSNDKQQLNQSDAIANRRKTVTLPDANLVPLENPDITVTNELSGKIDVSWQAISHASYYMIELSLNYNFPASGLIRYNNIKPNILSQQIDGLQNGYLYYIRLKAIGDKVSYSNSNFSESKLVITTPKSFLIKTLTKRTSKDNFKYTVTAGDNSECQDGLAKSYEWYINNNLKQKTSTNELIINDTNAESLRNSAQSKYQAKLTCSSGANNSLTRVSRNTSSWAVMQLISYRHIEWEGKCQTGDVQTVPNFRWAIGDGSIGSSDNIKTGKYFTHSDSDNLNPNTYGSEWIWKTIYDGLTAAQKKSYKIYSGSSSIVIAYRMITPRTGIEDNAEDITLLVGYTGTINPLEQEKMGYHRVDIGWGRPLIKSELSCEVGGEKTIVATGEHQL